MKEFTSGDRLGSHYEVSDVLDKSKGTQYVKVVDIAQNHKPLTAKISKIKHRNADVDDSQKMETKLMKVLAQSPRDDVEREGYERVQHLCDEFVFDSSSVIVFDKTEQTLREYVK